MIHDFKAVTLSQMCHGITDKTKIGIFQIRFKLCVILEIRSNNHSINIIKKTEALAFYGPNMETGFNFNIPGIL